MELFNTISPREQETIKHYIQLYAGVAEPAPLPIVLQYWEKNKKTLYKALGNKLTVRIPVEIPRNTLYYQHELKAIYDTYPIWDRRDADYFLKHQESMRERLHNEFVFEFLKFIAESDWCYQDCYQASRLILHQNIERGYLSSVNGVMQHQSEEYHFEAFKATIKNNMRTVRTIQKVLKAMRFPRMDLFEQWRNKVSDININQDIKADLVISIHPIDFMTMSDNNCDWTSCMSWSSHGAYSAGTIEMMNSNMAVLCYLESKTPYNIIFDNEEFVIPNKSWRTLLYVHKDIIVAGKAYPYFNENLTKCCLDKMRELLEQNLGWTYQYINQKYQDNKSIDNNFYLKHNSLRDFDRPKNPKKKKHAIYLYTNCMYNDLIEYKDAYWCCRNWVPKTIKLCVSGPATCMCCGEKIREPYDISTYDDVGEEKICYECNTNRRCYVCGLVKYSAPLFKVDTDRYTPQHICSEECLEDLIYVPSESKFYKKAVLSDERYIIVGNMDNFTQTSAVQTFIKDHSSWYYPIGSVIEDLKQSNLFKENSAIRVPSWVFNNYAFAYTHSSRLGYNRRQDCRGFVKFFDKDEKLPDTDKSVLDIINENKQWVPAKEVINEISSSVSS